MTTPPVFIVDDDAGVRTSLAILLDSAGIASQSFASAEDFLQVCTAQTLGCLLLDVRMQGMSGPQLQEALAGRGLDLPIIFLTGHAELELAVGAMRAGAVDFLSKPVNGALLLQRVQGALAALASRQQARDMRREMDGRLARLTQRERQVLARTVEGLSNKEIATALHISARTIEGHRARIYLKTGVTSVLELVQLASRAGISLLELLSLANSPRA